MGWKDIFKVRIPITVLAGGQILTDKKLAVPIQSVNFSQGKNPGEIVANVPFAGEKVFNFTNIEWEESHSRSAGKAAAGAIIGSVAGPVGTIAGAALGGKKKDTSKAFMYLVDQEGQEHRVHIKCDEKTYVQLASFIG
ncbi:hypothetical protein [Cytobacillus sp.]|uniref:hypothetical protein n=1 Tax=Cytobacillus sp. TaxID=2675269 RepID=UPI0035181EE6